MKLDIGKSYTIFTNSDFISNKNVRVIGWISYEKASQYTSFIENVSINEKFISANEDTTEYLKKQIYYECVGIELKNGEYVPTKERIILWDDIIDSTRTQRLYEFYNYTMSIKFKNIESTDNITKEKVLETIKNSINSVYNTTKEKVQIEFEEIKDNSLDTITKQLNDSQEALEKSTQTINSFNLMLEKVEEINKNFTDNNINNRVTELGESLDIIDSKISTIEASLK